MLQNLQKIAKFQKIQLDNLVDFEKCCKTRIFLQRSAPIQPKTSENLPKFCRNCQNLALRPRLAAGVLPLHERRRLAAGVLHLARVCSRGSRASVAGCRFWSITFGKLAFFCKFLAGSFSAVSKRNFVDEVERKTSRKTSKIQKNRKKMKNVYVKIT